MLNFTKNIILEPTWQKIYSVGRVLILLGFLSSTLYFLKNTFFPLEKFVLNLKNQKVAENLLGYEDVSLSEKIFSAYSKDNFSLANFRITTAKNQPDLTSKTISLRKTYSAFAYPLSEKKAIFPDRTLLKNSDQFFLVSNGKLRKFSSRKIFESLGYLENNFQEATNEEIGSMEKGEEIIETQNYPDNSLFLINDTYYEFFNNTLRPFASVKTFLSHCEKNQAITLLGHKVPVNNLFYDLGRDQASDYGATDSQDKQHTYSYIFLHDMNH